MGKPDFQARFDIFDVNSIPDEDERQMWTVQGTLTDNSNLGYTGVDVEVNDLLFIEVFNGDIDPFKIKRINSVSGNDISIDVYYIDVGAPTFGQPIPGASSILCANLGNDIASPPPASVSQVSDYLYNGVRTWNDKLMMNMGGSENELIMAGEVLLAGDFVNIYDDAGITKVRKAVATNPDMLADGYVLEGKNTGEIARVYFEGTNTQVTSLESGKVHFLSITPGKATHIAPNASGNVVQVIGKTVSSTSLNFELGEPIIIA